MRLFFLLLALPSLISAAPLRDCYFKTSDGVRLHYVEAGSGSETLIFVPGWMMPAAVFEAQVKGLSERFRVIAFDPRSQGKSELFGGAHTPALRSRDLQELLNEVRAENPILVGWSLGVMEVLDYLARYKRTNIAGLVLIDNSIGMGKPPASSGKSSQSGSASKDRAAYLKDFILGLTKKPMPHGMYETILASASRMPRSIAQELVNKPYPREYWRDTLLAQKVPVLYAIRPRFEEQGRILASHKSMLASVEVFPKAGHALFIDESEKFNRLVSEFAEKTWARSRNVR